MERTGYVTGLYGDAEAAGAAIENLIENRFAADEIGILVRDASGVSEAPVEHKTGVAPGATVGSALGAGLGALGGALVSIGVLPAAGLGLAAAGPIAAAASGAVAGVAGGGLLGTLAGLGFWSEAPDLPERLERGGVLVSVPASNGRRAMARRAMEGAGAEWVEG